jgi:hypothetical protein
MNIKNIILQSVFLFIGNNFSINAQLTAQSLVDKIFIDF